MAGIALSALACSERHPQEKPLPTKAPAMAVINSNKTKSCCTGKTPSRFGVNTTTFGIKHVDSVSKSK